MNERFAVIDIETTGLSPSRDSVLEIACVKIDVDHIVGHWSTLVRPTGPIPAFATAIHGIDEAMVSDSPSLNVALGTLRRFTRGYTLAAHNAVFDFRFLNLRPRNGICTMRLARFVVPEAPNHKNQTLRTYFRLDKRLQKEILPHRALSDALVTAHVLLACKQRCDRRRIPWHEALLTARVAQAPALSP